MKIFKFKGGTNPPERKNQARYQNIEKMPHVPYVYIPMNKDVKRVVKMGEYVKVGQVVAFDENQSYIHSSVSGEIIDVEKLKLANGQEEKVIKIKNDMSDSWELMERYPDYKKLSPKNLIEIIKKAGILGMGGAMFPTFKKMSIPEGHRFKTLIINGCECEPYLNADNRLMQENEKEIVEGIKIVKEIFDIPRVVIGIESNKKEAVFSIKKEIKGEDGIELASLKSIYPQGCERQLIKAICNIEIPKNKLPFEYEVLVLNVATCYAIYDAVINGKALIERIVTIAGAGVAEGKNLKVKIGTPIKDILDIIEYSGEIVERVLIGGPMTGAAQQNLDTPLLKGHNGILLLSPSEMRHAETRACIYCGSCVRRCPAGLIPLEFDRLVEYEEYEKLMEFDILHCIECGICSFTCPSRRPILEAIRLGKKLLWEMRKND